MKNQSGASLLELIIVVLVVGFIVLLIGNLPNSLGLVGTSKYQTLAKDIVAQKTEDLRAQGYDNLIDGAASFSDSRLSKLPASQATSVIEPCPINICTNSEAAKKVTVKVTWVDKSDTKKVEVVTIIAKGGLK